MSLLSILALAAACGGGGSDDPTATPTEGASGLSATATPFAVLPQPTIVTDASPPSTPSEEVTYIVEAGDSLSAIAERFDSSVAAIQERNDLTSEDIFVGQQLVIPAGESSGGTPDGTAGTTGGGTGETRSYTVQAGDFASVIAERFNVTLEALAAENDVGVDDLDNLFVGQVLSIPPAN